MRCTPQSLAGGDAAYLSIQDVVKDFSEIVELSKRTNLLLLTYATGVHHYFPTIDTAESWLIQWGQTLPPDRERLLAKLRTAEVVVEDSGSVLRIDAVDVVRGGGAVRYGPQNVGGVVNFVNAKPKMDAIHAAGEVAAFVDDDAMPEPTWARS